jgi:RNA polymerase sigma-70 factor (ECF subfamily)
MIEETEEALVRAAQSGDREALDRLLRQHRDGVLRYGLKVCPTSEDAEDAVQQTLWAAARSIHAYRRAASVATWLFTIVRNYCLRALGDPVYADLDHVAPTLAGGCSPEDEAAAREVERILATALSRVEPAHREILLLRDVRGYTAPEAAETLGLSVAAVKSRLHRARDALRGVVRELDLGPVTS